MDAAGLLGWPVLACQLEESCVPVAAPNARVPVSLVAQAVGGGRWSHRRWLGGLAGDGPGGALVSSEIFRVSARAWLCAK